MRRVTDAVLEGGAFSGTVRDDELQQALKNLLRNHSAQVGIRFEQPRDICEVLLPFAPAPLWILCRPHLALQDVLHARHGQALAQNLSLACTFDERRVSGIQSNLHAELAALGGDIHAVLEACKRYLRKSPTATTSS